MNDQQQTVREAAILIASLEQNLANKLLGKLSPNETAQLRLAMARLDEVEPEEQQTLVVQFRLARAAARHPRDTGVVLEGALADQSAAAKPTPAASQERPFRFLSDADPQALVPFLKREHGQIAAVVLSHLPPSQAAEVLAALPAAMQVDVVQRLANLDTADEETLQVVARELETWMGEQRQYGQRRTAGLQAVSGILAAASPTQQQTVVANLRAANEDLASQVTPATRGTPATHSPTTPTERADTATPSAQTNDCEPRTIDFDDLQQFDRERLAALATTAEPEIVVLALAGANQQLTARLLDALAPQQADRIRHQLKELGPIRLSDVEAAQRELIRLAVTLDDHRPRGRRTATDSVAA